MARFASDPDAAALGEGLAALRRAAGLSQAEAGARIGMTSQGWGLYEAGKRPGLFRPDVQRRTLIGLGLNKIDRTRELEDTPSVRGMVNAIPHLVKIIEERG